MSRHSWFLFLSLVCLSPLIFQSIRGQVPPVQKSPCQDYQKQFREFVMKNTFPFTISDLMKKRVLANYKKLKTGLSKDEVQQILGTPHFSKELYLPDISPPPYIGSVWVYFFYRKDPFSFNTKEDQCVEVFFDESCRTHWALPTNLFPLKEIGDPSTPIPNKQARQPEKH
ncbi:MAG: outer membrane protein assembly factor BamE [Acidobacteria bacterium]|nr:outer membrane protein assembly factor BamE [Acidobacteriota bacterium]